MKSDKKSPQESKPLVTKKDENEIYLINEHGDKLYRICGVQRNNMPPGYVCINRAGYKTVHVGWGPCNKHDRQLTNSNNTGLWARMNEKAGLPKNLLGFLEHTQDLEDSALAQVDGDIQGLYGMLLYVLNRKRETIDEKKDGKEAEEVGTLSSDDIELILKITDKIFKAKELRLKLNKELTLDMTTIKSFIDQMFKVILANAGAAVGKRLLAAILEEVIVPFKTQGRIKGEGFEYDLKEGKLFKEIEKTESETKK